MHSPAGRDRQGRWGAGPWDIASRAHILLRSSEFGLSGFRNYVQKGVNVNEGRRPELVAGPILVRPHPPARPQWRPEPGEQAMYSFED